MDFTIQYQLITALYQILQEKTDAQHPLSMPELIHELAEKGIHADRRRIYRCLESFATNGIKIQHVRVNKGHGYYLQHLFTETEAIVLIDYIASASSISLKETKHMISCIHSTLSKHQVNTLPPIYMNPTKTENDTVIHTIQTLLPAITSCISVEFQYFDITIDKNKKYRKNGEKYHLTPYAIVSDNGKYYCVFYDHKHENFSNYRLDKMENIQLTDQQDTPLNFSLPDHMRNSMKMYHGQAATVTAKFAISLASQVIDQFGDNIIVSYVDATSFVASIRTTLSPTLRSWVMLFYNQIEILYPESFREEMRTIGYHLINKYKED